MNTINRRAFMKNSAGTIAAVSVLSGSRAFAANEKMVVGVMGLGGRGTFLAERFAERPDVEIAYLCDPDSRRLPRAKDTVTKVGKHTPKMVQDFRRILEDKSVDVVVNATPDHWHALGSILACQAGKHVYVEKPISHNLWEGRKMVEASRKYKRVIQAGLQTRSTRYLQDALAYIKTGKLGDVKLVKVYNMMSHPFIKAGPDQPVPEGFDYELWCGPAPKIPYNPSRRWLGYFDYSCGPIPGDLVHQVDAARCLMGDPPSPTSVNHTGGISVLKDGRDTPDTQIASFDYGAFTLITESSLWTPYIMKTPMNLRDKDTPPNWPFNSTRVELYGTKGFLYFGRHGDGWQAFDEQGKSVVSAFGRQADKEHVQNFFDCIRTGKLPNADIEQAHYSTLLCHLANISWRLGNIRLEFDGASETFRNPEANRFVRRTYREPWVVPEKV
jgi:predicted dehydrogenase